MSQNLTPLSSQTITVPAAALGAPGIYRIQMSGQVLVCRASTAPLQCKMDAGSYFPIDAGFVIPGGPAGFGALTFANFSATPIVLTVYAGELGINVIPNNYSKVYPTYTKGTDLTGGGALASGAYQTFNGTDPANSTSGARKQITVQNLDNNGNSITVLDGNGTALATLAANSPPWTVETSGVITVKNTSAGYVTRVIVGEIFYAS